METQVLIRQQFHPFPRPPKAEPVEGFLEEERRRRLHGQARGLNKQTLTHPPAVRGLQGAWMECQLNPRWRASWRRGLGLARHPLPLGGDSGLPKPLEKCVAGVPGPEEIHRQP